MLQGAISPPRWARRITRKARLLSKWLELEYRVLSARYSSVAGCWLPLAAAAPLSFLRLAMARSTWLVGEGLLNGSPAA